MVDGYWYFTRTQLNNSSNNIKNTSATLLHPFPFYRIIGQPQTINLSATDINGDSLVYHLVIPKSQLSQCNSINIIPITDIPYVSPFSLSEPFATNGTFTWDSINAIMSFTAAYIQRPLLTLIIDEYRNGVWVGNSMRDMPIVFFDPPTTLPVLQITQTSSSHIQQQNGDTLFLCPNVTMSFCNSLSSTNPLANLQVFTNVSSRLPLATINYTNVNSNNVEACISWTPLAKDSGWHSFYLEAEDTSCNAGVVNIPVLKKYTVYVRSINDSTCWPLQNSEVLETNKALTIYPNPASNVIDVSCQLSNFGNENIEINNSVGQKLEVPVIRKQSSDIQLDITHLSKGIYFIKVANYKIAKFVKEDRCKAKRENSYCKYV